MRSAWTILLFTIVIGLGAAPVMAQGITAGYIVHINFFYTSCWLTNMQVILDDQTGRIVGSSMSSDGSQATIAFRSETTTDMLTARVSGLAGTPSNAWIVSGTSTIIVEPNGGDYSITVRLY